LQTDAIIVSSSQPFDPSFAFAFVTSTFAPDAASAAIAAVAAANVRIVPFSSTSKPSAANVRPPMVMLWGEVETVPTAPRTDCSFIDFVVRLIG